MRRRHALTLLASSLSVGLAGCSDRSGGETSTPTPTASESPTESPTATESPTPTATPATRRVPLGESAAVDGGGVTAHATLRRSVVLDNGTWYQLQDADDHQYLVVRAEGVDPRAFDLRVDGERVEQPRPLDGANLAFLPVDGECDGCWPYRVPVGEADSAALHDSDENVAWTLPDPLLTSLGRTPRFELWGASAAIRDGGLAVDLRVANVGNRDGRFLGLVALEGLHDLYAPVAVEVTAGSALTGTVRPARLQPHVETRVEEWGGESAVRASVDVDGVGDRLVRVALEATRETATAR